MIMQFDTAARLFAAGTLFLTAAASAPALAQDAEQPAPASEAEAPAEPNIDVVEEKQAKITDKSHPEYVRCRSEAIIGSRAKRKRTCMTNREWAIVARRGNEATRGFVNENQPGFQRIPGQN